MWEEIKQDFRERFMNFETVKGIYFIPAGGVIIYVSIFWIQYVLQSACIIFGVYCISEGLRKIFVNRIKQDFIKKSLLQKRINGAENEIESALKLHE